MAPERIHVVPEGKEKKVHKFDGFDRGDNYCIANVE